MRVMLVVVCGMHRSGSTLVAQLAKGLLSASCELTVSSNGLGSSVEQMHARASDPAHTWLAKVHIPRRELRRALPDQGALYLYTYRDVRDALASAWRKNRFLFGSEDRGPTIAAKFVREEIEIGAVFEDRRHCWIGRYETIVNDIPSLVNDLESFLDLSVSTALKQELVEEAAPDKQRQRSQLVSTGDQLVRLETFITTNHITDGRFGAWKETLSVEEAIASEHAARDWLRQKKYPLCFRKAMYTDPPQE
ncbi:sulfotransferase domain-containing protein [Cyanobium sp. NS01]|uniref:sulfotransferase domain-containing protein n=1 Tax=Cyanobium sp. NS01 TaxID=261284 RepID=UPI00351BF8F4